LATYFACSEAYFSSSLITNLKNLCGRENALTFDKSVRKKLEARDILGPELAIERVDPTLIDAVMGVAVSLRGVPERFSCNDKLSAFVRDKGNIAFKLSKAFALLDSRLKMITTNLGRLSFPDTYGNLKLEQMVFAPSTERVSLMLGSVGVSGRATFTLNYMVNISEAEDSQTATLIAVRNRALEYLGLPEKISNSAF
jgi:hypothetical protein